MALVYPKELHVLTLDTSLWRGLESIASQVGNDSFFQSIALKIVNALRSLQSAVRANRKTALAHQHDAASELHAAVRHLIDVASIARQSDQWTDAHKENTERWLTVSQEVLSHLTHGDPHHGQPKAAPAPAESTPPEVPGSGTPMEALEQRSEGSADTMDLLSMQHAPYTWLQDSSDSSAALEDQICVSIPVPATVKAKDVEVTFRVQHLRVAVRGHPVQPAIIDEKLLHSVDVDESSWALEGLGRERMLIVRLGKAEPMLEWLRLLDRL